MALRHTAHLEQLSQNRARSILRFGLGSNWGATLSAQCCPLTFVLPLNLRGIISAQIEGSENGKTDVTAQSSLPRSA